MAGRKISFELTCAPTPQQRVRHGYVNGRPVSYKSTAQKLNEKELDMQLLPYAPEVPLEGALSVSVVCHMPLPASLSRSETGERLRVGWHITRPDLDNMIKQLWDALSRADFWTDDDQVSVIHAMKIYSQTPGWTVKIKELL